MVTSGVYVVKEDGLVFEHDTSPAAVAEDEPTTSDIFLQRFRKNFKMKVVERPSNDHLVVEFMNVDVSFVNALRRILIAEVPTVAIENVFMWNNNGMIHDEVLAHRLGLIPLNIDARLLDDYDGTPTDRNTVVFSLMVSCNKNDKEQQQNDNNNNSNDDDNDNDDNDMAQLIREEEKSSVSKNRELEDAARVGTTSAASERPKLQYPKDRPYTKHIYSKELTWVPQGEQIEMFGGPDAVKPIYDDILIAKLRPGHYIELEAHAIRGIGKDHAKYSPVCTASYRLMPQIEIIIPIYDAVARELVYIYEPGVFVLQPTDPVVDPPGTSVKAVVLNPYACTMSRNYMKNPILSQSIVMKRLSNHFIFSIESVGQYPPGVLLAEAIRILQSKSQHIIDLIDEHSMKTEIS